ncbi:hypothetical protein BHM03_00049002 [Ensete ventricosum]|nr:hypothetical protein BHM03_00049002 [Ensete ventricosum]
MKKCDGHKLYAKSRVEWSFDRFFVQRLGNSKYWPFPIVEFRLVFHALSQKFKILAIPDVLAQGKSYEHGFAKKHDDRKLCTQSREVARTVEFRSLFHAPSRKLKILAIPDVFAHGKSYEHDFRKKHNGYKLCVMSVEFQSVFLAPSRKFKILAIPNVIAHGKSY